MCNNERIMRDEFDRKSNKRERIRHCVLFMYESFFIEELYQVYHFSIFTIIYNL